MQRRLNTTNKFWWFVAISAFVASIIITVLLVLLWKDLPAEEKTVLISVIKENAGQIFIVVFLFLGIIGLAIDGILHNYILPINKLVEEVTLITTVNPSHRIQIEGGKDIIRLAETLNRGADQYYELQNKVAEKIARAKIQTEEERNILSAFMAELPEGVLICNADGRILGLVRALSAHHLCIGPGAVGKPLRIE